MSTGGLIRFYFVWVRGCSLLLDTQDERRNLKLPQMNITVFACMFVGSCSFVCFVYFVVRLS